VEQDLTILRYDTFVELSQYCYGVAATVGLMYMSIVGYQSNEAVPYAVKMGVALQMTNILRDVAEDWQNNRLYLPRQELAYFGLDEGDVQRGLVTPRWREFMRFQISRAKQLFQESLPGIALVNPDGRLALYAAADFYRGILDDITAHDYDVFSRRAHLSGIEKIRRIPILWLRTRAQAFE